MLIVEGTLTNKSEISRIDLSDVKELAKTAHVSNTPETDDARDHWHGDLLSAGTILATDWPEPNWAVPDLIPTGLCILGGAPKAGKSLFALQLTQAVALGGTFLGRVVETGPTLYFALEDPPRRLKERMIKQGWSGGGAADFLTIGSFVDRVGDLRFGGAERISRQIEQMQYRLVVIDTLSRALLGDQNDVREMTSWLSPLQEMAHKCGCALLIIDHHKKSGGFNVDVISDILGSTAKGAIADTVLGLYKERGKPGARLAVSGREVAEEIINLRIDPSTATWILTDDDYETPEQQKQLLDALETLGPSGPTALGNKVGFSKGKVYHHLSQLEHRGLVYKQGSLWKVREEENQDE
jgi:hypothetical protein